MLQVVWPKRHLGFPWEMGRTCAVTTTLIVGSAMALAQLDLINMAGAGFKPLGEQPQAPAGFAQVQHGA